MTVKDYISQKFQTFGINLSEADLLEISLSSEISGEDEMDQSNIGLVSVAMRFLYVLGHQRLEGILLVLV